MQKAWQRNSFWCNKHSSTEISADIEAKDRIQLSNLPAAYEMIIYAGTSVRDELKDKYKNYKAKLSSHLKGG